MLAADVAAAEAREALARAVEARVSLSASADEADAALAASRSRVRCEYGYIQSNGVYIDVSKTRPRVSPRMRSLYPPRTRARAPELRKFLAGTEGG